MPVEAEDQQLPPTVASENLGVFATSLKLVHMVLVNVYQALLKSVLSPMVTLLTSIILLHDAVALAMPFYLWFLNPLLALFTVPIRLLKSRLIMIGVPPRTTEGVDIIRSATGYMAGFIEATGNQLFNWYLRCKALVQQHLYGVDGLRINNFIARVISQIFAFSSPPVIFLYETILKKHVRCIRYLRRFAERRGIKRSDSGLCEIKESEEEPEDEVAIDTPLSVSRPKRKREMLDAPAEELQPTTPTSPEYLLASENLIESDEPIQVSSGRISPPEIEVQPPMDEGVER